MEHHDALPKVRRLILIVLVFGLVGTAAELLFLGHNQGLSQLVPIVLIASALIVVGWHVASRTPSSLTAMRVVMVAFIASGAVGIVLHFNGSAEFQSEIDPSIQGIELFRKVLHSKTPPALAPGLMAQLGLLGLAYAYRHPTERSDQ